MTDDFGTISRLHPLLTPLSRRSTFSLCGSSGLSKRLQASAYLATSRSVFFSPPPPMSTGGWGRCTAGGEFSGR